MSEGQLAPSRPARSRGHLDVGFQPASQNPRHPTGTHGYTKLQGPQTLTDNDFMRRALSLARRNLHTHPNPRVGAVVVQNGKIVGEGWHNGPGTPHAEAMAFAQAGDLAHGATVYVTLEPCSHTHNPDGSPRIPCAQRCIEAGVKWVVGAMVDPDMRVSGRGFAQLKAAGVEVEIGVLEADARKINEAFIRHRTTGLPFITHKAAQTLDGKIASVSGDSKWITGESSRAYVHKFLRNEADAVVVGAKTVLADNPHLTTRLPKRNAHQPLRVIIDSTLQTPPDFHVAAPDTLFIGAEGIASDANAERLRQTGADVFLLPPGETGRVGALAIAQHLAQLGKLSVLLESGGTLAAAFWQAHLINQAVFFIAPKVIGGASAPTPIDGPGLSELMANAQNMGTITVRRFGNDVALIADVAQ